MLFLNKPHSLSHVYGIAQGEPRLTHVPFTGYFMYVYTQAALTRFHRMAASLVDGGLKGKLVGIKFGAYCQCVLKKCRCTEHRVHRIPQPKSHLPSNTDTPELTHTLYRTDTGGWELTQACRYAFTSISHNNYRARSISLEPISIGRIQDTTQRPSRSLGKLMQKVPGFS